MASQSARRERGDPVNVLSAAAFKGRVTWVLPPSAQCATSTYAKSSELGLGTAPCAADHSMSDPMEDCPRRSIRVMGCAGDALNP